MTHLALILDWVSAMIEATITELRRHGSSKRVVAGRTPRADLPAAVRTARALQQARLAAAQLNRSQGHGFALP